MTGAIRKYNNLTQRIITGVVGAAAIITGVVVSEWLYFAIFFVICFFTLREFYRVVRAEGVAPEMMPGLGVGSLIFLLTFFISKGDLAPRYYLLMFPIVAALFVFKLYKRSEKKPFSNLAFTVLGWIYVAVPVSLINYAAFFSGTYRFEIILGLLLMLWSTDTGAYFAGTWLGKIKLFPRVSPKKTWEGFAGGALLALIFAVGLAQFFDLLTLFDWIAIALILIVFGTFGDLVESLLKRSIEIKDSGSSLPGHGGFLDRFDGLLIAAPFVVTYLLFLK